MNSVCLSQSGMTVFTTCICDLFLCSVILPSAPIKLIQFIVIERYYYITFVLIYISIRGVTKKNNQLVNTLINKILALCSFTQTADNFLIKSVFVVFSCHPRQSAI